MSFLRASVRLARGSFMRCASSTTTVLLRSAGCARCSKEEDPREAHIFEQVYCSIRLIVTCQNLKISHQPHPSPVRSNLTHECRNSPSRKTFVDLPPMISPISDAQNNPTVSLAVAGTASLPLQAQARRFDILFRVLASTAAISSFQFSYQIGRKTRIM